MKNLGPMRGHLTGKEILRPDPDRVGRTQNNRLLRCSLQNEAVSYRGSPSPRWAMRLGERRMPPPPAYPVTMLSA